MPFFALSPNQNYPLRTQEDEDLIQKVSDVMKMDEHGSDMAQQQVPKTTLKDTSNPSSCGSTVNSQKSNSAESSSNSFSYVAMPQNTNDQAPPVATCNPVISMMLSNNQPPIQFHHQIHAGYPNAACSQMHPSSPTHQTNGKASRIT